MQAVPLFVGVVVLTFVLVHVAPGDPIYTLAGESGDAAYYAEMRARFGLDRSIPEQLGVYMLNVVRGDLGQSYVQKQPVWPLILSRVPATLLLTLSALLFSVVLGVWLGSVAAARAGSWLVVHRIRGRRGFPSQSCVRGERRHPYPGRVVCRSLAGNLRRRGTTRRAVRA